MRRAGGTERFHGGDTQCSSKLGELLSTAVLWLLPSLLLAQVPRPGDDRPELPDFLPAEQPVRSNLAQHPESSPGARSPPLSILAQAAEQISANTVAEQADAGAAPTEFTVQHVVQVGAFADPVNAARLLGLLQQRGFTTLTRSTINEAGVELTRVLAGPFANRGDALAAKAALEADGWTGFVLTEPLPVERAIGITPATQAPSTAAQPAEASSTITTTAKVRSTSAWALPGIATHAGAEATLIASTPHVRVSGFRFRGNSAFPDEALLALTAPFTNRELSFEDLLRLRDELTLHYVTNGYVTSGVVLPEQVSRDGIIEFEVVEGTLGKVNVIDARRLRPSWFERRLMPAEDEIVDMQRLEERLQLLQQDPLIHHVEAQLVPGPRRAEAQLDLRVFERRPFGASVEVNNYQAPAVGAERITARFWHRNLRGGGDAFRTSFAASEGLEELEAIYELPLNSRGTRLGLRVTATRSEAVEAPFDELDIESETETYALDFSHPVGRSLNNEFSLFGSAEYRRSKSFLLGEGFQFSTGLDENGVAKVAVLRLGLRFTHRDQKQVFAARSIFSAGLDALDATINDTKPDGEFISWLGQFQWARRFDWLAARMIARIDVQLALDPLLPLEQFAVGGHATVRGYRENRFVRDNGLVSSIEFRIPIWRRASGESILEIAPFYDYGRSWNRDRPTPSEEVLSSAGIGLIAPINALTYGELYWGHALRDVPDISDEHNLQDDGIHFRFRRVFE